MMAAAAAVVGRVRRGGGGRVRRGGWPGAAGEATAAASNRPFAVRTAIERTVERVIGVQSSVAGQARPVSGRLYGICAPNRPKAYLVRGKWSIACREGVNRLARCGIAAPNRPLPDSQARAWTIVYAARAPYPRPAARAPYPRPRDTAERRETIGSGSSRSHSRPAERVPGSGQCKVSLRPDPRDQPHRSHRE